MDEMDVELTAEEEQAALKAALSMKMDSLKAEEAAVEAKAAAEEAAKEAEAAAQAYAEEQARLKAERKASPSRFVGLVAEGSPEPSYFDNPSGDTRDRIVHIGGVTYEHTHDDEDGVWLFRHF
jgi:multidrug efflux pump subunit AcrA (membrane-fusion protein)